MPPTYTDADLVQQLNNIFLEKIQDKKLQSFTVQSVRAPTSDFVRDVVVECLVESGFSLSNNVLDVPEDINSAKSHGIMTDFIAPLQLMVTARKFYADLSNCVGESNHLLFGWSDLVSPEYKRIKYFLSHFINFWLLCNYQYEVLQQTSDEVDEKVKSRVMLEEKLAEYKRINTELRNEQYSSLKKAEKVKEKIDHDREKLGKLTNDVRSLTEEVNKVKEDLNLAKNKDLELDGVNKDLSNNEFRLKTISKADETKQELEARLETLRIEEEKKLYQLKDYQIKQESYGEEENHLKEAIAALQATKDLSSKKKMFSNEKKSLMQDCEVSQEKLEAIEAQVLSHQRVLDALKMEISTLKGKWDKNKNLMEKDLASYTEQLTSLSKALNDEDMGLHELDSKISETMLETEDIKGEISKEKDNVHKCYEILMQGFMKWQKTMEEDCDALKKAWEKMRTLKY